MGTEAVWVESIQMVEMEKITSMLVTNKPIIRPDGSFSRWEKICKIFAENPHAPKDEEEFNVSRSELKRIKKRLANHYGRKIVLTKEQVVGKRPKRATKNLPEDQRLYTEVVAYNWHYEVVPPPFAEILAQRQAIEEKKNVM